MKVLFIEPYPTEGPSSRYRVEQYVPYLEKHGVRCIIRPFISPQFYRILYKKGSYLKKLLFFIQGSIKRFFDIFTGIRSDIIFIHLEAFPVGPPIIEWIFSKFGKTIIYDLDDAIYMRATNSTNRFSRYLKCPSKIKEIIKISAHIITCNEFLADYARQFNKNVTAIHTSVDTKKFMPKRKMDKKEITLGWIGSHSTSGYLEELKNVFYRLSQEHKFTLKIIGARKFSLKVPGVEVINLDWRLNDEIEQFQSLDIGIYPLPENEWTRGKTGFKTIQYMSVGIPCVVSNVGANRDIVKDGVNGFLVSSEDAWIEKLSLLIKDSSLRQQIGMNGRETIKEKFSLEANAPKFKALLERYEVKNGKR